VVHTFYEPWRDTNGNGIFDAGEEYINISAGGIMAVNFDSSNPTGWGPIWTEAQVNTQIDFLKAALAQARIRAVITRLPTHHPVGNLFAQQGSTAKPPTFGRLGVGNETPLVYDPVLDGSVSRDLVLIQTNFRTPVNFNGIDSDDVVDIYFVPPASRTSELVYGFAMTPVGVSLYSTGAPTLPASFANQAFVCLGASLASPGVLAHEIMHLLTNEGDVATPRHIFFPASHVGQDYGSTPAMFRRLQEATVTKARTERAVGNVTALGNRLLRNP
jgi:hypothetical protein